MTLTYEKYIKQKSSWPVSGRHILAQYNENSIVVYQAFCPEIADYAIIHQKFGGNHYNMNRMSWIKTNFLWMMYRSGWAQKKNQEKILAIHLSVEGFENILLNAYTVTRQKIENKSTSDISIRLQWDPDHDPYGGKEERKAIQLGLKNDALIQFNENWIQKIEDVTEFVKLQFKLVLAKDLESLTIPKEDVYTPKDINIKSFIGLDDF